MPASESSRKVNLHNARWGRWLGRKPCRTSLRLHRLQPNRTPSSVRPPILHTSCAKASAKDWHATHTHTALFDFRCSYSPITSVCIRTDIILMLVNSGVPRIFFRGGGSTNSVEDRGQRGRGSGGGSPLVRGSGGSCNLVQEI